MVNRMVLLYGCSSLEVTAIGLLLLIVRREIVREVMVEGRRYFMLFLLVEGWDCP